MLALLLLPLACGFSEANRTSASENRSLMASFVPGFQNFNQIVDVQNLGNVAAGVPILHTITQAIPSFRALPGMNVSAGSGPQTPNRNLNSAIEQFTAPIVRFATGGRPVASDIQQFIQSIPNFVVNMPGAGDIDLSKIDPNLIDHVLKGRQIPGIPKESMDTVIQNVMKKVYEAAAAAKNGTLQKEQEKFLIPMDKLPKEMVANVVGGRSLPGLTQAETETIKEYYTKSFIAPIEKPTANATLQDILAKIPKFEKPVRTPFSPYDINQLSTSMIDKKAAEARADRMRMITAISLGIIGGITLFVVGIFIVIFKKKRANRAQLLQTAVQLSPGPPLTNST